MQILKQAESYAYRMASEDDDRWQGGSCLEYAHALKSRFPHLGVGTLNDSDGNLIHFFAHDSEHAYDSAGKHPMPYKGLEGNLTPELNERLEDYDEPWQPDVDDALKHIDHHQIGPRTASIRTAEWGKWKQPYSHPSLPEGHTFQRGTLPATGGDYGMPPAHALRMLDPQGQQVGEINWAKKNSEDPGEITWIGTHPDRTREGIASTLYNHAKEFAPHIHHSDNQTNEGAEWAERNARTKRRAD